MPRTARYVVLHHIGSPEGDHFDLMVENQAAEDVGETGQGAGRNLATWRLPGWPVFGAVDAKKLRDHRPIFLTFQGEISGGRGSVVRVAEGTVMVEQVGTTLWVRCDGWGLELTEVRESEWVARRE